MSDMQAHLDAFTDAHPDQMLAHLKGEHHLERCDRHGGRSLAACDHQPSLVEMLAAHLTIHGEIADIEALLQGDPWGVDQEVAR
jgi:hypothetical protein